MSSQKQISNLKTEIERLEARHSNNIKVIHDLMFDNACLKAFEHNCKELTNKNEFLQEQLTELNRNSFHMKYEDFCTKKNLDLIKINFELKDKIAGLENTKDSATSSAALEKFLNFERTDFENQRKIFFDEKHKFEFERKEFKSKINTCELTIQKLSKQVSDFEQIVILERKSSETKCLELSKKVSELQKILDDERTLVENNKKDALKKNVLMSEMNKSLENKKKVLNEEIPKLLKKLSDLQSNLVTEKKLRVELKDKYDLLTEKRDHLVCKIKELEQKQNKEKSVFPNSTSSSIASSSNQKMTPLSSNSVCQNNCSSSVKSNSYSNDSKSYDSSNSRTQNSKRIYNDFIANSGNSKKFRMVWRKKSTTDDSVGNMQNTSPVVDAKSFVSKTGLPNFVKSINQLISLSASTLCCSFCGTNDFVDQRYNHKWYGTYSIPSSPVVVSKANLQGPNKAWVPKFINPFCRYET